MKKMGKIKEALELAKSLIDEFTDSEMEQIDEAIKLCGNSVPAETLVIPKIADLQKRNSKLTALLQMRDGGDHNNDCKANYGRQCNCGHNTVKLYFDSNFSAYQQNKDS